MRGRGGTAQDEQPDERGTETNETCTGQVRATTKRALPAPEGLGFGERGNERLSPAAGGKRFVADSIFCLLRTTPVPVPVSG